MCGGWKKGAGADRQPPKVAFLAGVRDMSTGPVTIVSNATNVGFPVAINQGLRLARGEYLVMLNNDVVVTDAWLNQLIALVNAEKGLDAEQAGVSGDASADGLGRPSVDLGAGSGDPRTAPIALRSWRFTALPGNSVRGVFDEIVIFDTGSVDRTKEIAREFDAKVFDFVWIDDFAAARNVALRTRRAITPSRGNRGEI